MTSVGFSMSNCAIFGENQSHWRLRYEQQPLTAHAAPPGFISAFCGSYAMKVRIGLPANGLLMDFPVSHGQCSLF